MKDWFRKHEMLIAEVVFWTGVLMLSGTSLALVWIGFHCPIVFVPRG